MNIATFLEPVAGDLPELASSSWAELEKLIAEHASADEQFSSLLSMCLNPVEPPQPSKDVAFLQSSPLAAWLILTSYDNQLVRSNRLRLYHALEPVAERFSADIAVNVLNMTALLEANYWHLNEPVLALKIAEHLLEVTDENGWHQPDFIVSKVVLEAAVEGQSGPISPMADALLERWGNRLAASVEAQDEDGAYSELQLLNAWRTLNA